MPFTSNLYLQGKDSDFYWSWIVLRGLKSSGRPVAENYRRDCFAERRFMRIFEGLKCSDEGFANDTGRDTETFGAGRRVVGGG